jgi:hypothetical protein
MKIIAFLERHQTEVIEKILRHCGLWEEGPAQIPISNLGKRHLNHEDAQRDTAEARRFAERDLTR